MEHKRPPFLIFSAVAISSGQIKFNLLRKKRRCCAGIFLTLSTLLQAYYSMPGKEIQCFQVSKLETLRSV